MLAHFIKVYANKKNEKWKIYNGEVTLFLKDALFCHVENAIELRGILFMYTIQ